MVRNSVEWKAEQKDDGMDVLRVDSSAAKSVPLVAVSLELLMVVWKVDQWAVRLVAYLVGMKDTLTEFLMVVRRGVRLDL